MLNSFLDLFCKNPDSTRGFLVKFSLNNGELKYSYTVWTYFASISFLDQVPDRISEKLSIVNNSLMVHGL